MTIRNTTLLLVFVFFMFANQSRASDNQEIREILFDLMNEIRMLQADVRYLTKKIEKAHFSNHENRASWGCYLNDIRAGGISGTGATKEEAIGILLEKCTEKNGACFESGVKCSSK